MAAERALPEEGHQYHHFIPQFILNNFAHMHRPKGKAKSSLNHDGTRLYKGQKALHVLSLTTDPPILTESLVRRSFGLLDMYRDFSAAQHQNYLEKELGNFESRASHIIKRILQAFDDAHSAYWLSRPERNELRKFFFLMKYRGNGFHQRFLGDENGKYVADDESFFLRYMREHAFQKPLDVWFHSIQVILNLEMDNEGRWRGHLVKAIYPDDAYWFIMHSEMMYLAFCTPDDSDTEFIITNNSYAISEGPFSLAVNPATKEVQTTSWTAYHEFGPLGPRLMMVLGSFMLPSPEEDRDENIKQWREKWYEMNAKQHADPSAASSVLADLPISKARNSYPSLDTTGLTLLDGEDGSRRSYHKFCFRFFKISVTHVRLINTIMLDNAKEQTSIAFRSRDSFKDILEHYITLPAGRGFKTVHDDTNGPKLRYLRKLEQALRQLGSNKSLVYNTLHIPDEEQVLEEFGRQMVQHLPSEPTEFAKLHMKLGGHLANLVADMTQSRKMIYLRIKIDVWSQGIEEGIRQKARDNLLDLYCNHVLPHRIWFFMKRIRFLQLSPRSATQDAYNDLPEHYIEGPADAIARACSIVDRKKLGRLMCLAASKHIFSVQNPGANLATPITFDYAGMKTVQLQARLAFGGPHRRMCKIRDCGIKPLEKHARSTAAGITRTELYRTWNSRMWTEEENIEMVVRLIVRRDFEHLLRGMLSVPRLEELKEVLFIFAYPTYDTRPQARSERHVTCI